ncbi:MAG: hypothetical protein IPO21_15380 [Bacteroidales bacterium]|nr:hypothetical protein [Bacteroidales bacterium]
MKRNIFIISVMLFVVSIVKMNAQNITSISETNSEYKINFTLPSYKINEVNIFEEYGINQNYSKIELPEFGEINKIGLPILPQYSVKLRIPDDATTFNVYVSNIVTQTIYLQNKILPFNDFFETDTVKKFVLDQVFYSSNGQSLSSNYNLSNPFTIMGVKGINFSILPFKYNPITKTIQVIKSCTYTITHNGNSTLKSGTNSIVSEDDITQEFLKNIFTNYSPSQLKSGISGIQNVKYLIIAHKDLWGGIQQFASYKRNLGYDVTLVSTWETGTEKYGIRNYIKSKYDNKDTRPVFVLLVGGPDHIEHFGWYDDNLDLQDNGDSEHPATDLDFTLLDGDDFYPDILIGRFFVDENDDLKGITRRLMYSETHLDELGENALLISGGPEDYFEENLTEIEDEIVLPNGYATDHFCEICNDSRTEVLNAIASDKYNFFIYRGHGGNGWLSGFNLSAFEFDPYKEGDNDMFGPMGFGFTCWTNTYEKRYGSFSCFGRRYLKVKGISYFGSSTISQSYSNNKLSKDVIKSVLNSTYLAQGTVSGVNNYHGGYTTTLQERQIRKYNLLGDPSFEVNGLGCRSNYNLVYSQTFEDKDIVKFKAINDIVIAGKGENFEVNSGAQLTLLAGNQITFKEGTIIKYGSVLNAYIQLCGGSLKSGENSLNELSQDSDSVIKDKGIIDLDDVEINISPNPTSRKITISGINGDALVEVVDVKGSKCIQKRLQIL